MRAENRREFNELLAEAQRDKRTTFRPYLLRRLVTFAIANHNLSNGGINPFPAKLLAQAEELIFEISAVQDRLPEHATDWDHYSLAARVIQHQPHDQLDSFYYSRSLALLLEAVSRTKERGLDVNDAFRRNFHLSFEDFAFLSFAFFAIVTMDKPGWRLQTGKMNLLPPLHIEPAAVDAFWSLCSLDYGKFRKAARHPAVVPLGYETYALSPLVKWPLISHPDGTSSIPIATDMLDRAIYGFRVDIREFLGKPEVDRFWEVYGSVLEDDVYSTLERCKGVGHVRRAAELLPGETKKCDFICDEETSATLVEVKSAHFRLRADQTKNREELKNEFEREGGIAEGIGQLNASALAIRRGKTNLRKGTPLHGLLVVSGEPVLLNSDYSRDIIGEILSERGELDLNVKYQIANEMDFRAVAVAFLQGGSLGRFLYAKCRDPSEYQHDIYTSVLHHFPNPGMHPWEGKYHDARDRLFAKYGLTPDART